MTADCVQPVTVVTDTFARASSTATGSISHLTEDLQTVSLSPTSSSPTSATSPPPPDDTGPTAAVLSPTSPLLPASPQSPDLSVTTPGVILNPAELVGQLRLAQINAYIKKLSLDSLRVCLRQQGLSGGGTRLVVARRMREHVKSLHSPAHQPAPQKTPAVAKKFLVVDFEATCESPQPPNYPHEVIEFPMLLVSAAGEVLSEFHSYVRPQLNATLSSFCTQLTGISQQQVTTAPTFPEVLSQLDEWLASHDIDRKSDAMMVTDSCTDVNTFLLYEMTRLRLPLPWWAKKSCNLRKVFSNYYKEPRMNLNEMLTNLGMTFQGRPHSGIDDARNITRILAQLVADGAQPTYNEFCTGKRLQECRNMVPEALKGQVGDDAEDVSE